MSRNYPKTTRTDNGGRGMAAGSVTVEAALVFPIFFFTIWMIWQLFMALLVQMRVTLMVAKTQGEMSVAGYAMRERGEEDGNEDGLLWTTLLYINLLSGTENMCDGLTVSFKNAEESVYIIEVTASIPVASPFSRKFGIPVKQSYKVRANTGVWDENAFAPKEEKKKNGENVYVTENGTVYHRSRACSHLAVKAEAVPASEVGERRNRDGKKYTECSYCRDTARRDTVYITAYGTKYHYSTDCRSLTRVVKEVPLEEVKDMKPCSTCGGNKND